MSARKMSFLDCVGPLETPTFIKVDFFANIEDLKLQSWDKPRTACWLGRN